MLKYLHHLEYVVKNRDEMVAYLERNFGMKPDKLWEHEDTKEAQYRVGQTLLRIREPLPGTKHAQFLEKNGPGILDVVWGVDDNIPDLAQQLKAKGLTLKYEQGFRRTPHGYYVILIDPKDSLGIDFNLAGGPS